MLEWIPVEEQVEELSPVGLKLYPNSYTADGAVGWHMDDPEIAFPLFQRAMMLMIFPMGATKTNPLRRNAAPSRLRPSFRADLGAGDSYASLWKRLHHWCGRCDLLSPRRQTRRRIGFA
jgi:hypothetical protein